MLLGAQRVAGYGLRGDNRTIPHSQSRIQKTSALKLKADSQTAKIHFYYEL